MSRFFDLISKPVREEPALSPAAPTPSKPSRQLVHMDANENPFGPSPRALEAMRATLAAVHSYPDDDCSVLRHHLAGHHGMAPEQILVTAGSTEMIALLCLSMLGPGLNAVTSERSFIVYAMAVNAAGGQLIEAPMKNDGLDLDAILAAINEQTRLVLLANPNNPTGTMLDAQQLDRFIGEVPPHVLIVLDEAYFEFARFFSVARNVEYSRALDYVRQDKRVIVLRTFSKAHGLAGLRIGYGIAPAQLLAPCARMQSTFSVSSIAQTAAVAALEDQTHLARVASNNAAQSDLLGAGLIELGYRVVPTWANFVYCDLGDDAAAFADRLIEQGISVRPLGQWGAPTCIRISIGTPDQNQMLLTAIRKMREIPATG